MAEEDKMTGGVKVFKELVGLVDTKLRATIIVALVICIGILSRKNDKLQDKLDISAEERRKEMASMYERVIKEINPRIDSMSVQVNTSTGKVDTLTKNLNKTLKVLDSNIKKKGLK